MTQARLTFGGPPNYLSQPLPGVVQVLGPNQTAGGGGGGGGSGGQPGYDSIIQVFGGKLCNGSNTPIILAGANLSGPDFVSIQGGTNPWDFGGGNNPGVPYWSLYNSVGFNVVRIRINCSSWLGDTVYDINAAGTGWGAGRSADPGNNFKQTIIDAVASAQANGMYVVLAAAGSAPDLTFAGVTQHLASNAPMAVADANTLRFWQSITQTFGTQATPPTSSIGPIKNAGVLFDLLNTPHPSNNYGPYMSGAGGTGSVLTGEQVLLNGGYGGIWPYTNLNANGGASGTLSQWQPVIGYQAMSSAIRGAGAQNVCIVGGDRYCRILSTGLSYLPTDPFGQTIFSIQSFAPASGNSYPETGSYVYCETDESDGSSGTLTCLHYAKALVDAGYPVLITADGGYEGFGCTSGEPHLQWVFQQVTAGVVSGVILSAANPLDTTISGIGTNLIFGQSNVQVSVQIYPTQGEGAALATFCASNRASPAPPSSGPGYTGLISVSGNTLVNGSGGVGTVIQLRGVNQDGLEYTYVQNNSPPWSGHPPNSTLSIQRKLNCWRIPVNAGSILGLTTFDGNGRNGGVGSGTLSSWGSSTVCDPLSGNPSTNYMANLITTVKAANAAGCYAIIDMHWTAPAFTVGGVTHYLSPLSQAGFLDMDMAWPAWQELINTFGTNATPIPGINLGSVIFEFYNEPAVSDMVTNHGAVLTPSDPDTIKRTGGTATKWSDNQGYVVPFSWNILGYQQLVDYCVTGGHQNVCIVNGDHYASTLGQYTKYLPTDSRKQIAFGWHTYGTGDSWPYTTNGQGKFPGCGADAGGGTAAAWNAAQAILNAGYPVLITEDGGNGAPGTNNFSGATTYGEPHIKYIAQQCDARGISYIPFQDNLVQAYGNLVQWSLLMTSSDGLSVVPLPAGGVEFANWASAHAT